MKVPANPWRIGERVELTLHYQGPLPASKRYQVEIKNSLRSQFHQQLVVFCKNQPRFQPALAATLPQAVMRGSRLSAPSAISYEFFGVSIGSFEFVPLVSRLNQLVAEVRIDLYRREEPGDILTPGGDLDNRLKMIFDGLRLPQNADETIGFKATDGKRGYCVLEDDSLIRKVALNTFRLIEPAAADEKETDVRLVLHVDIWSRYA